LGRECEGAQEKSGVEGLTASASGFNVRDMDNRLERLLMIAGIAYLLALGILVFTGVIDG
jgi:hypothetical protein